MQQENNLIAECKPNWKVTITLIELAVLLNYPTFPFLANWKVLLSDFVLKEG